MTWTGSNRKAELPSGWAAIRARILRRDGYRCYRCGARANEVDHIRHGNDHADSNLAAICTPCHRTKSSREGGRSPHPPRATEQHPKERHPGYT